VAGADIRRFSTDRRGTSLNAPLAALAAALMAFADALLYPALVLPVVVGQLTGNLTTVGLAASLAAGLWFIPQIISAGVIQDRRRVKPVLIVGGITRAAAFGLFTYIGFRADDFSHQELLRWLIFALVVATTASAFSSLPLTILTARSVSADQQRTLFSGRVVLAGVLAIVAGLIVASVFDVDGPGFPRSLTLLVLAAAGAVATGTFLAGLIREPKRMSNVRIPKLAESISGAIGSFGDRAMRRFILYRCVIALSAGIDPLLIIYGMQQLAIPPRYVGFYLIALVIGRLVADPIWAWLARSSGHRAVLQASTAFRIVAPGIALLMPSLTRTDYWQQHMTNPEVTYMLFGIAFAALGIALAGQIRGSFGYMNEIVPSGKRFHAANMLNALLMVLAFAPVVAASIAKTRGIDNVIAGGAVILVFALLLSGALINATTTIRRPSSVAASRIRTAKPVR
jgi:hypothetical protein